MSNESKALKSGFWYTISNFFVRGIGFITTPIFTRLLSTEEFGDYNNFVSWMSIFTIVVTLNLESTFISAKYDYKDRFDNYIFSVLTLSMFSCLVWSVLLNILGKYSESYLGMSRLYINCMMVHLFFHPAITFFQSRERYLYRYKSNVITSIFLSVGTSLISVILVVIMSNKLNGRVFGHIIPTISLGILFSLYFVIKERKIDFRTWKYAFVICLPYIPHLLSLTLLNSMDRTMIKRICGSYDTALYSLAYTCGALITLLITSMNGAFSPWLGDQLHNKEYKSIRKISSFYILTFCYFAIAVMLVAPEILFVLGKPEYQAAKYVMPPVTMGCICQFIYTMFVNVEQFCKKTIGMAIGSATAALLNYVLNLLLIPIYGYIAAAYTTLLGFLWLLIVHMFLVYRLKLNHIYNYRMIISLVTGLILITLGINCLYKVIWIRWLCVVLYSIVGVGLAFMNKERFLYVLKKIRK